MRSINEISPLEIERLDSLQLVKLLLCLLTNEACKYRIPLSGVSVPLNINVADGGEDARIQWGGYPDNTDWLPTQYVMLQCKATELEPSNFHKEVLQSDGSLKPKVEEVLSVGGAYIIFYKYSLVRIGIDRRINNLFDRSDSNLQEYFTKLDERIEKVKEGVAAAGRNYTQNSLIDIYDANRIAQWVNQYPQAVLTVDEFLGNSKRFEYKTWSYLSKYPQFALPYFPSPKLDAHIANIRKEILSGQAIIRITGLAGLGKTRLIYEAFKPSITQDDVSLDILSNSLIYYDHANQQPDLVDNVADLVNRRIKGVIVIDNCNLKTHKQLVNEVRAADNGLSLITIEPDPEENDSNLKSLSIQLQPNDFVDVIPKILKHQFKGIPESSIQRICEYAQGITLIATTLAEDVEEGIPNIGHLKDKDLTESLLGRPYKEDSKVKDILRACAIFEEFGFEEDLAYQYKELSRCFDISCLDMSPQAAERKFREVCLEYKKRGLLEGRGRKLFLKPKPLALRLAAEWWKNCPPENIMGVLGLVQKIGLTESLCRQIEKLDFLPHVRSIAEELCGIRGPFGNAEVLNTREGSRIFRSLIEVNPQATTNTLYRIFVSLPYEELLKIEEGRRNLVWALEKLCFRADTFEKAAKVLFAFAVAENETWGNNATNQFLQLFHIYLPNTQANLESRKQLLSYTLENPDQPYREFAIKALASSLTTDHFSRMGGAETIGSNLPMKDYEPGTWQEKVDYWQFAIDKLTQIALTEPQYSEQASTALAYSIRGLHNWRLAHLIVPPIEQLITFKHNAWDEALKQLWYTLKYEEELLDEEKNKIKELIELLKPVDLKRRLQLTISKPEYEAFEENEENSSGARKEKATIKAENLAEELAKTQEDWLQYLPYLYEGEQDQAYFFGRKLGEILENNCEFIDRSIAAIKGVVFDKRNLSLLGGFVSGVADKSFQRAVIKKIIEDKELKNYAFYLTRMITPDLEDVEKLFDLLSEGIPVTSFMEFRYGRSLEHFTVEQVKELAFRINQYGNEGVWTALEILHMYCYGDNNQKWTLLMPTFKQILYVKNLLLETEDLSRRDVYTWESEVEKLLEHEYDTEFAKHIAQEIVVFCSRKDYSLNYETYVFSIVKILISKYFNDSWPILGEGLLSQDYYTYSHLKGILGNKNGVHEKQGLLFKEGNLEELFIWCKQHEPEAPIRIAGMMPFATSEGNWHPFALRVINEFGDNYKVLQKLSANMHSYTMWGSSVPYLVRNNALVEKLTNHESREIKEWALKEIEYYTFSIKDERHRDAEGI